VIRRGIFTAIPPAGDYFLSTTGLTWNVDRTSAGGGVLRILAGERNKKSALATLLGLAAGDGPTHGKPLVLARTGSSNDIDSRSDGATLTGCAIED
jgi:hypothetical protein